MTDARWRLLRRVIALAGFSLALLAVAADSAELGWAAIVLLLAALAARWRQRWHPEALDGAARSTSAPNGSVQEEGER
ncbi:MAG: hypothetical protein ABIQ49_00550 [Gemmatimonadales bacterium]